MSNCVGILPHPRATTAIHPDQLQIVRRLHLTATSSRPSQPVAVMAGDLLALLNGFASESRRADIAEAQLAAVNAQP